FSVHCIFFFYTNPATPDIYTLSLHDALPICPVIIDVDFGAGCLDDFPDDLATRADDLTDLVLRDRNRGDARRVLADLAASAGQRSEEHTSELQSLAYLVCRLLLEKKKT